MAFSVATTIWSPFGPEIDAATRGKCARPGEEPVSASGARRWALRLVMLSVSVFYPRLLDLF